MRLGSKERRQAALLTQKEQREAEERRRREAAEAAAISEAEEYAKIKQTINIAPTWGAIGDYFFRIAESNEQAAMKPMREEVARAFSFAEWRSSKAKIWPGTRRPCRSFSN